MRPAFGHPVTSAECAEGSEFIENAARARDNGQSRARFMSRLADDLTGIRAFPPALRWFAQDEADEALLLAAASEVFDDPKPPEVHRRMFLERCLGVPVHDS